jgi:hypothetical protein
VRSIGRSGTGVENHTPAHVHAGLAMPHVASLPLEPEPSLARDERTSVRDDGEFAIDRGKGIENALEHKSGVLQLRVPSPA